MQTSLIRQNVNFAGAKRWIEVNLGKVACSPWKALMRGLRELTGRGKSRPEHQERDVKQHVENVLITLGVPMRMDASRNSAELGLIRLDSEAIVWMVRHAPDCVQSWVGPSLNPHHG